MWPEDSLISINRARRSSCMTRRRSTWGRKPRHACSRRRWGDWCHPGKLYVLGYVQSRAFLAAIQWPTYSGMTRLRIRGPSSRQRQRLFGENPAGALMNEKFYLIGPKDWSTTRRRTSGRREDPGGEVRAASSRVGRQSCSLTSTYSVTRPTDRPIRFRPGIFIYDPVSDRWEKKPLNFGALCCSGVTWRTPTRVFLNGEPRVEWVGGFRDYWNNLHTFDRLFARVQQRLAARRDVFVFNMEGGRTGRSTTSRVALYPRVGPYGRNDGRPMNRRGLQLCPRVS